MPRSSMRNVTMLLSPRMDTYTLPRATTVVIVTDVVVVVIAELVYREHKCLCGRDEARSFVNQPTEIVVF